MVGRVIRGDRIDDAAVGQGLHGLRARKGGIEPQERCLALGARGQQQRFDDGHEFEDLARPLAEEIVGDDLYPVVGSEGLLSASFDGLTMDQQTGFEHKTLNSALRAALMSDEGVDALGKNYRVQMEQQCMVSGPTRILFMASKWREAELVEEMHCWYEPDAELRAEILAGWEQFERDLEAFEPTAPAAEVVGRTPETLPALRIEVTGAVTASNLLQYKEHALAVFAGINRDLKTDQDFANADKTVKWCAEVESRLAAAKQHALSQTESIDALFKTIDDIMAESRPTRLELDKLVKARKEARRGEIVAGAVKALADHIAALNARIGKPYMPAVSADFGGAIKGLRTFDSMQNAVDTALAQAKIAASATADRIQTNLNCLREKAADHVFLFPDTVQIVQKAPDDLATLVTARIAEHTEKERKREEAQREAIRQQELDRIAREQKELADRDAVAQVTQATLQQAAAPPPQPDPVPVQVAAAPAAPARAAAPAPSADAVPTLSLGTIKSRIAPIEITAAGLSQLGFTGVKERGSVLYHEHQYPQICEALIARLEAALEALPA